MTAQLQLPHESTRAGAGAFRVALIGLRILLGTLMITATFVQLANYEVYWRRIGLHDLALRTGNFFSAFTFDTNLLGALVLLTGAVLLWRRVDEPPWFSTVRLCLLAAMVILGAVYQVLLSGIRPGLGERVDWANTVVHVIAPFGIAIDWLVAPHTKQLPMRNALFVVAYPLVWLGYSLIRGTLVRDELLGTTYYYPYPFLNPHGSGGWTPVLTMIGALIVFILIVGVLGVLVARVEDRVTGRVHLRHAL
jgi:hypothetical protein